MKVEDEKCKLITAMNHMEVRLDQRIDKVELRIDLLEKSFNKRMDLMCWFMGAGFAFLSILISLVGLAVMYR